MTKSQSRLLTRLRNLSDDDLTDEDREDLVELEELEESEKQVEKKTEDPLKEINKKLEEMSKWMKPQELPEKEKLEVPTPTPVITNQDLEQEPKLPKENQLKKILKNLW